MSPYPDQKHLCVLLLNALSFYFPLVVTKQERSHLINFWRRGNFVIRVAIGSILGYGPIGVSYSSGFSMQRHATRKLSITGGPRYLRSFSYLGLSVIAVLLSTNGYKTTHLNDPALIVHDLDL